MSLPLSRRLSGFLTRDRIKSYLISRSKFILLILILFYVLGYFGEAHRYFDLVSHFKVQYLIVSFLTFLVFAVSRIKVWAALGLIAVSMNAYAIFPLYFNNSVASADTDDRLSLMLSNVLAANTNYSKLVELVRKEKPDILVAQEVNEEWAKSLASLQDLYPYKKVHPRDDNFGIAIYSRFPFEDVEIIELGDGEVPSISAKVIVSGKGVHILATHPVPPINEQLSSWRNSQLSSVASYMRKISSPKILVGDLNTSVWSPFYARLVKESGLRNCRDGHGVLPTWPTNIPFLMIPLDHCLVSDDVRVKSIETGINIGSDHLPLLMKFSI